jgi:hypothetical protein
MIAERQEIKNTNFLALLPSIFLSQQLSLLFLTLLLQLSLSDFGSNLLQFGLFLFGRQLFFSGLKLSLVN